MKHCKEHSRRFCLFCIGTTLGFPLEHFMWEHMPGLVWISTALRLS